MCKIVVLEKFFEDPVVPSYPPGLLQEVARNFKQLSQRKDLTLCVNANYKSIFLMHEYLINSLLFISTVWHKGRVTATEGKNVL